LPHSTPLPPHIAVSVAALVDRAIMLSGSRLAERRHESVCGNLQQQRCLSSSRLSADHSLRQFLTAADSRNLT
jgi:hypothetical protein